MRTIGELLSVFLDEKFAKTARKYSALTSSWVQITERAKIPAAADHSRIVELEKGIVFVETDHPGWLQIFQTKQGFLLSGIRRSFPDITGISFRLSKGPLAPSTEAFPAGGAGDKAHG
jgi:predicted nucleic acid-binding Zn ribbon protein